MRSPPEGAVPQPECQGPACPAAAGEPDTRPLAVGAAGACTVLARLALQTPHLERREMFLSRVVFKIELFPTLCVLGYPFPSVSK